MEQYIETRAKIKKDHPGLLDSVRQKITMQPFNASALKIDRDKNLRAISKMLELKTPSVAFQNKLQKMILESQI